MIFPIRIDKAMYITLPLKNAYRLLNAGSLVVVSTSDGQNYNLAPIAWNCPVEYDPVTQVLIVVSRQHKTHDNIIKNQKFTLIIPHVSQKELVVALGSVSGHDINKFNEMEIPVFYSESMGYPVLKGAVGYIDCNLIKELVHGDVSVFIGEAVYAGALEAAFDKRLLCEKPEGKTLHHLGNKIFATFSDKLV